MILTDSHCLEPVLSRADAAQVAETVAAGQASRTPPTPLARVVLSFDPRYSAETVSKFRERLAAALSQRGLSPRVEVPAPPAPTLPPAPLPSAAPLPVPAVLAPARRAAVDPGGETDSVELDLESVTFEEAP